MPMKTHDPDAIFAPVWPWRWATIAWPVIAAALLEDGWLVEIEAIAAA
jgi:hypothetical protein